MMDVTTAPRKHPTIVDGLSKVSPPTRVTADVEHTVVDGHDRSNQGLAGVIERVIEGIAVY